LLDRAREANWLFSVYCDYVPKCHNFVRFFASISQLLYLKIAIMILERGMAGLAVSIADRSKSNLCQRLARARSTVRIMSTLSKRQKRSRSEAQATQPRGASLAGLPMTELQARLGFSPDGFSQAEAQRRLAEYGYNEISEKGIPKKGERK
jgi:hypothetical protein